MQTALYHLATGIHGTVHAYRTPPTRLGQRQGHQNPDNSGLEDVSNFIAETQAQGLPGWGVVKVVRAGPSGKIRGMKPHNVLREVLVLQKARHPNVVRIVDYAWSESVWEHQLALPLLAITLCTLLESPTLTLDSPSHAHDALPDLSRLSMVSSPSSSTFDALFRSVAFQLLSALAHLHGLGIAHRDIKPENVMLDWDGTVVLVDFGIAWDVDGEDWGGEWKEDTEEMCCEVGTGPYRAPELLFGPLSYDPQSLDLWAAGCVLAEFFTLPTPLLDLDPLDGAYADLVSEASTSARPSTKRTLFDSTFGDLGLAGSIFSIQGSPTAETWPTFTLLPDASKIAFTPQSPRQLLTLLRDLARMPDPQAVERLLNSLLALEPSWRTSAAAALELEVFRQEAVLLPARLMGSGEYARMRRRLRSLDEVEGTAVRGLLEEVMGPSRRRWESMG